MLELTKYENRKLYSKTDSKYLTLGTLRDKIRAGVVVKVTEHKTGADVTANVLKSVLTTMDISVNNLQKIIKGE